MVFNAPEDSSWAVWAVVSTLVAICLGQLYRSALPKPIPGVPYDEASSRKLLGDVPAMMDHMTRTQGGTFITYILKTMRALDAPLIQVFIRPFGKPLLILGDFPEAHDLLVRRKQFDRSHTLGDLVLGLAPDHHIHLETGDAWKTQRRLVQDLMMPSFLHNVAGPALYQSVSAMIDLWREKAVLAAGRPWRATDDVNQMALDAITAFAFGEDFKHKATRPTLEAVRRIGKKVISAIRNAGIDESVVFPKCEEHATLRAIRDLTETVGEVQGNPFPGLTWAYITRKSKIRRAIRLKEDCIAMELRKGLERFEQTAGKVVKSAIDQMIIREHQLAIKDGRAPDYFSRVMIDEQFGFIFAGHETTSTTLCWSLKYLTDHPKAQERLRASMQSALLAAKAEKRNPTIQEITSTQIPYLDATIEETLRCAGTAPVVDRVATVDTELLGHRVPKGTVVTCLVTGPTMKSPGFEIDISRRSTSSRVAIEEGRVRAWRTDDIAAFDPGRWLVDNSTCGGTEADFDPTAGPQLAFGLGTRGCYGKRLVYLEMRIVLTLVVWNFELLPCPSSLSTYHSKLITTNEPIQTYVRLRDIQAGYGGD
ncbi:cytochrome P450 monooxygenase [Xylaria telfairii]|nr:cytochrome P450 monooxygenase [Xylaria telfairii]